MDFLNTEEKRQRRLVHLPMGRFGEAVELARAALFREHPIIFPPDSAFQMMFGTVASDESSYVTVSKYGYIIDIDLLAEQHYRVLTLRWMVALLLLM